MAGKIRVARLNEGEYFGEIGVLSRTQRTATIQAITPVECLTLDREALKSVLAASREAYEDMDTVLRRRMAELGVLEGTVFEKSLDADLDTVIEARLVHDQLKVLNGDDLSRILGRLSFL